MEQYQARIVDELINPNVLMILTYDESISKKIKSVYPYENNLFVKVGFYHYYLPDISLLETEDATTHCQFIYQFLKDDRIGIKDMFDIGVWTKNMMTKLSSQKKILAASDYTKLKNCLSSIWIKVHRRSEPYKKILKGWNKVFNSKSKYV